MWQSSGELGSSFYLAALSLLPRGRWPLSGCMLANVARRAAARMHAHRRPIPPRQSQSPAACMQPLHRAACHCTNTSFPFLCCP